MKTRIFSFFFVVFVVSMISLNTMSATRGTQLQQICSKSENGYSDQCITYINGLKEGLLLGSQTGAVTVGKRTNADKEQIKSLNDENTAAYLDYCQQSELETEEITDKILKHLKKNRSLAHQPVALTFVQIMQKSSPITDCSGDTSGYAYGTY